jgi:glycogen synthase
VHTFPFEVYEHVFDDGQRAIYFWDQGQLHWTNASAIYPSDPWMALGLYATVGQAMASYIAQGHFDTVHLHDYHVGLVPFYLGDAYLQQVPTHLTIHNAATRHDTARAVAIAASGHQFARRPVVSHLLDFFNNLNTRLHAQGARDRRQDHDGE